MKTEFHASLGLIEVDIVPEKRVHGEQLDFFEGDRIIVSARDSRVEKRSLLGVEHAGPKHEQD